MKDDKLKHAAPRWMLLVGLILLLWNLMGVGAFVTQWTMTPERLATLPPEQQDFGAWMPVWTWAAYAIAVFGGTAGAIGLLMRKKWSVSLFFISLIALLVQLSYTFVLSDGFSTMSTAGLIFPAFIVFMAILQWQLSRAWLRQRRLA